MLDWKELPKVDHRVGWPWSPRDPKDRDFDLAVRQEKIGDAPPVLVVTPSFNQGGFLEQTIRSVLLQGYPNLIYRVIDGGSTDNSLEIIERYKPWLDRAVSEPDRGQSHAIIKGIDDQDSGWFGWINSDDWLAPQTLQHLATPAALAARLVGMSIEVVGDGNPYQIENRNLSAEVMLRDGGYSFAQPGLWFDLGQYHLCGGIDQAFQYGFDWDLIVRYLAINPAVHYADHVGASFRVHEESKTSVESNKTAINNRFEREHAAVRTKLEGCLSAELAAASRFGRRARSWRQRLETTLDNHEVAPLKESLMILGASLIDPRVRFKQKTWTTIARLLSRYVRPKSSIGTRSSIAPARPSEHERTDRSAE